jgi:DNA repair protein RadD
MNTEHARRCIGVANERRCDYYFEFKACPDSSCGAQNDIAARLCHKCGHEIIDPNAKLSLSHVKNQLFQVNVLEARYGVSETQNGFRINCAYKCQDDSGRIGSVFENYSPISEKAARVFYGQFVKKHCSDASKWYIHLGNRSKVESMLQTADTPLSLLISREQEGMRIRKKIFVT